MPGFSLGFAFYDLLYYNGTRKAIGVLSLS